jgi:serine/threonine protein kinase
MSDPDWSRVAALFQELADLPPAERAAVLARCPDAAVRAEVASLLEADAGDGPLDVPLSPLAVAGVGSGPVPDDDSAEGGRLGERLGPYVVRERIGAGGMGAVYRAERTDAAYDRAVAIKVIKRGMDTEAIVARFRRERDVLARLDHPYIARLVDGGTTADGLPFVVMDLVDGVRIDRACDERRLPIEARLRLFCKVCDAVQHAHQKLVVHRDLKPDNVLVTADGTPRLLDFGIAALVDAATDGASLTRAGGTFATPAYASPEQLRGEPVGTASDVYSLGVLLHELLTGRLPRAPLAAVPAADTGARRTEPRPPSSVVLRRDAADGTTPETLAERRGTTPAALARRLRGDLDTIALRATAEDPARRYASVEQLVADVWRHLDGLPVLARPDAWTYRLGKFVGRHRAGVLAAAAIAVALVAALGVSLASARTARDEARKAEEIARFVQDMLGAANPLADGRTVTVAQVLGQAARRADVDLRDRPDVQAAVRTAIGGAYLGLGLYDEADAILRTALVQQRAIHGGRDHDAIVDALLQVAEVAHARDHLVAAEARTREALAMSQRLHRTGDPALARPLNALGGVLLSRGDLPSAEHAHREALAHLRAAGPLSTIDAAEALNDLAVVVGTRGDRVSALALHEEAAQVTRAAAAPAAQQAMAYSALASALADAKVYDRADALFRETLALRERVLGPDHPDLAWTRYNYAFMLFEQGRLVEAEQTARALIAYRGRTLPDSHPTVAATLQLLGRVRLAQGDAAAACPLLTESLALRRASLPADHWLLAMGESVLGECLGRSGRAAEAEPLLVRSAARLARQFAAGDPRVVDANRRLATFRTVQPAATDAARAQGR